MLVKYLSKFRGGLLLFVLMPIFILVAQVSFLSYDDIILVDNAPILAITMGILWEQRRFFRIILQKQKDAGLLWLNLGHWGIAATTVLTVLYSTVLQVRGEQAKSSLVVAALRLSYAIFFSCLFLAPLAHGETVPMRSWKMLGLIIGLSGLLALLGTQFL